MKYQVSPDLMARLKVVLEWAQVGFWIWLRDEDKYSLDYIREEKGSPQDLIDHGFISPARLQMLVENSEARMRRALQGEAPKGANS